MSKRRTFSVALTLALTVALLAPQAALGSRALYGSAAVAGDATLATPDAAKDATAPGAATRDAAADEVDTADGAEEAGEAPRQPKRGNAFTRALTAPFRALARLFGGGKKSKSEQAKKQTPAPARTEAPAEAQGSAQTTKAAAPQPATTDEAKATTTDEAKAVAAVAAAGDDALTSGMSTTAAPAVRPAPVVSAQPAAGARIIRPDAGELATELRPKMWVPLIVGVPADPVSQGRALLQHGYIQEAIAELQTAATNVGPELAEANNLLGLAYDRLGWHRQAAEAYERALAASPKNAIVLANLGYSLYLADDYAGALKRLKQAAKLMPGQPVVLNNLGVVHARLGQYGEAYKSFARSSNEYEAHIKLAGILEDLRRDREALKHYETALRIQPGASAVLERLVALYERTGARDKADTARRTLGQPKNQQKTTNGGGG